MAANASNTSVRLEMPTSRNLPDLMNQIRTWLDSRKIEPSLFRIDTGVGSVVLEIGFPTSDAAEAFRRDFQEGLSV